MRYVHARPARLHGYSRRFWQGSHDHRGTPEQPGRVVTLVPETDAHCDGMAYLLEADVVAETFEQLDYREKNGYERFAVTLQFAPSETTQGLVYIAPQSNPAFLGDAPLEVIARQILACAGPSGRNIDYLTELARSLRNLDAHDEHVFDLETLVLESQVLENR
jgi:cation transport regulator ChaC